MKVLAPIGAFALALALTGAANAATTTPAPDTQKATQTNNDSAMQPMNANNLRSDLRADLTKAGFTSIKITPSSFFVEAHNKKGEPIAMVIGPDSFTEVTEVKAQASNTAQPQTQQGQKTTQK